MRGNVAHGTYDPESRLLLYWPLAILRPDYQRPAERKGDNFLQTSDSVLALDPDTGRLKWHYQVQPHDVFTPGNGHRTTDAASTRSFHGQPPRKTARATRETKMRFFYVLESSDGPKSAKARRIKKKEKTLRQNITWRAERQSVPTEPCPGCLAATSNCNNEKEGGQRVCPAVDGSH